MSDLDQFLSGLVTTTVIGSVLVGVFAILRPRFKEHYQPRCNDKVHITPPQQHDWPSLPEPQPGVVGWASDCIAMSDEQLMDVAGLDATMYCQIYRIGMQLFGAATLLSALILIPVNATSEAFVETENSGPHGNITTIERVDGLASFSLANLPTESDRLFAPLIAIYALTAFALHLLNETYKMFIKLRQRHLRRASHNLTVLVRDVPERHRTGALFYSWMKQLYPTALCRATLVKGGGAADKLDELVVKRTELIAAYEHAFGVLGRNRQKAHALSPVGMTAPDAAALRPTHMVGGVPVLGLGATKVDSLDTYEHELNELNEAIVAAQTRLAAADSVEVAGEGVSLGVEFLAAGFATFDDPVVARAAAGAVECAEAHTFLVEAATEARDVLWANLRFSAVERSIREVVGMALTVGLLVLWVIPISFVAALTTLEALSGRIPFLEGVADLHPALRGFLQSFLPGLALLIFLSLLPALLIGQARITGLPSQSACERNAIERMFLFQALHSFILLTLAGSVFEQLDAIIDAITSPSALADLLGAALPQFGTFFTTFVMLNAFVATPLALIDPGPLIVGCLKKRFVAVSDKEHRACDAPRPEKMVNACGAVLLSFIICFSYCVIQPVICFVGIAFFAIGWLVARYRAVYVCVPVYESGGQLWPVVHDCLSYSLIIGQVTFIGVVALKQHKIVAPLALPLPYITLLAYRAMRAAYLPAAGGLTVEEAALLRDGGAEAPGVDLYTPLAQRAAGVLRVDSNGVTPVQGDFAPRDSVAAVATSDHQIVCDVSAYAKVDARSEVDRIAEDDSPDERDHSWRLRRAARRAQRRAEIKSELMQEQSE